MLSLTASVDGEQMKFTRRITTRMGFINRIQLRGSTGAMLFAAGVERKDIHLRAGESKTTVGRFCRWKILCMRAHFEKLYVTSVIVPAKFRSRYINLK